MLVSKQQLYLKTYDIENVPKLTDDQYESITLNEIQAKVKDICFIASSLYRISYLKLSPAWLLYVKQASVYLHESGIFRVSVARLKREGILLRQTRG